MKARSPIWKRAFTTTVNDIEHIESQTMPGLGVIKVFFQPNAGRPQSHRSTAAAGT